MLVRSWLTRRSFESERRVLERKGQWGATLATLEWLHDRLRTAKYTQCDLNRRRGVSVESRYENVDLLLQHLRQARWIAAQGEMAKPTAFMSEVATLYTVDEYLVDVHHHPIAPEEVRRVLASELPPWLEELGCLQSEDGAQRDYYQRKYSILMDELRLVMMALYALSDQWGP